MLAKLKDLSAGNGTGNAVVTLSAPQAEFLSNYLDEKKDKALLDKLEGSPIRVTGGELAKLIQRAEAQSKEAAKVEG
jgi:hypothetical protein